MRQNGKHGRQTLAHGGSYTLSKIKDAVLNSQYDRFELPAD